MDTIRDQLFNVAASVRKYIETKVQRSSWGLCNFASEILAKYLLEVHHIGPVEVVEGRRRDSAHVWIEYGGYIIDITADQFPDKREPVIVTTDRAWHDRFPDQIRDSPAGTLRNDFTRQKYEEMLIFIGQVSRS